MKHKRSDESIRGAVKKARPESRDATANAEEIDEWRAEADAPGTTGHGAGAGALSDKQGLELSQESERNRSSLNPIQSVWPT